MYSISADWSVKLSRICANLVEQETVDEWYYGYRRKLDAKALRKEVRVKDVEIQIAVEELEDAADESKPYVHAIREWWTKEMDNMIDFQMGSQMNPFMIPI